MFTLFSILSLTPPMCPPSNPAYVPQPQMDRLFPLVVSVRHAQTYKHRSINTTF